MGCGGYCLVRRDKDWSKSRSKDTFRVMMLFWAANNQFAEVMSSDRRSTEVSSKSVDFDPPDELLPEFSADWSNAETIKSAKKHKIVPIETASYDMVSFKYRTVYVPRLQIHYASRKVIRSEMPFAIVLNLTGNMQ